MKRITAIAACCIASLMGGVGLVGVASSTPAAAAPLLSITPSEITVIVGSVPGAYAEIVYQLNTEGVPAIRLAPDQVIFTLLGEPGAFVVITY
jgi:hypothetical protein